MRQLGFPVLLCHRLITDDEGRVVDYKLRQADPKRQSIRAFKTIYYRTIAAGDSYNDTTMLAEADAGILFHAPQNVINEFPQFPAVHTYEDLKKEFIKASNRKLVCKIAWSFRTLKLLQNPLHFSVQLLPFFLAL